MAGVRNGAFARAKAMMAMIHVIVQQHAYNFVARNAALQALGPYRSHGHGRGTPSKRYGNKPGKYCPHQGKRECARRFLQRERNFDRRVRRLMGAAG